jgi:hypothetical protein
MISPDGITVDPSMVRDVLDWKTPTSVHQVQSFLGLAGYYRRLIRNLSKIVKPITKHLKKGNKYVWSDACGEAFQTFNKFLTTSLLMFIVMLLVLDWDVPECKRSG